MLIFLNKKGQNTAEYVVVLGLIVAAVVAMQTYVKRGLQGRIKDAVDYTDTNGANTNLSFSTKQYEPYYASSEFSSTRNSGETENLLNGGGVNRSTSETSNRTGIQQVGAAEED